MHPPTYQKTKGELPDVTQPWYLDNVGELGTFAIIETCFNLIKLQGLARGYYPKPSMSVLILHPDNLEAKNCLARVIGLRCTWV